MEILAKFFIGAGVVAALAMAWLVWSDYMRSRRSRIAISKYLSSRAGDIR